MDFSNNMMSRKNSSSDFVNIYDVESDENLNVKARPSTRRPSNIKGIAKKEYSYLEIDDGSFCGLVEIEGGVQVSSRAYCLHNQAVTSCNNNRLR